MPKTAAILFSALAFFSASSAQGVELSLFDGGGEAHAYVSMEDDYTIYLWDGRPVAYMSMRGSRPTNVYGFNGKHLGWFIDGAIYDRAGMVMCAFQTRMGSVGFEPFKGLKELIPLKSLEELEPLQPLLTDQWSDMPCKMALYLGAL
jgi:hypothetical protein